MALYCTMPNMAMGLRMSRSGKLSHRVKAAEDASPLSPFFSEASSCGSLSESRNDHFNDCHIRRG